MASVIRSIGATYNYVMYDLSDPRISGWVLTSPLEIFLIIGLYLYVCLFAAPKFMKNREPFELKYVMICYNSFQVLLNSYLLCLGYHILTDPNFDIKCQPVDYVTPTGLMHAKSAWLYYFCKITDLCDTVFFILRKKSNQVTFLHVYHHFIMVFAIGIGFRYVPGGSAIIMGTINCFVHIVMYTYYLLTSLGPQYTKCTWWKKHLTQLQLTQFIIVFICCCLAFHRNCGFPRVASFFQLLNASLFIYLFGRFYIKHYLSGSKLKSK